MWADLFKQTALFVFHLPYLRCKLAGRCFPGKHLYNQRHKIAIKDIKLTCHRIYVKRRVTRYETVPNDGVGIDVWVFGLDCTDDSAATEVFFDVKLVGLLQEAWVVVVRI